MSVWLLLALSIMAVGVLVGIVCERNWNWDIEFFDCLVVAFGICLIEAVVYGFYKLIPWVLDWNAEMIVKISFLAMPTFFVLAFALMIAAVVWERERCFYIALTLLLFCIASGIVSAVFAWIPSAAWQIGILIFFGIPFAFLLGVFIWLICSKGQQLSSGEAGGYLYSFGDHAEVVTYYPSRRAYRESRRSTGGDTYYMDPSF